MLDRRGPSELRTDVDSEGTLATRIPDLWQAKEDDATRLYAIFLARLQMNGMHKRIVAACRQIRRYADRGPGRIEGLFTFSDEIDALCDQKQYKMAWRQLRLRHEIFYGQRLELNRRWTVNDYWDLWSKYAPLLFFLKRYRDGCLLLETALDFLFAQGNVQSFDDILFHVYNNDKKPSHRCLVTLSHFYKHLGKDLREWRHWEAFVNGFHPKLFRLAGVTRAALLADASHINWSRRAR